MLDLAVCPARRRFAVSFKLVAAPQRFDQHRHQHFCECGGKTQNFRAQVFDKAASGPWIVDYRGRRGQFGGSCRNLAALDENRLSEARHLPDAEPHDYSAASRSSALPLNRGITSSVKSFNDRMAAS